MNNIKFYKLTDNNLCGGSFEISKKGTKKNNIIKYPEVTIELGEKIGKGNTSIVYIGKIIDSSVAPQLKNKIVVIKQLKDRNNDITSLEKTFKRESSKLKYFNLDKDNEIVEIDNIIPLYFKIKYEPIEYSLIYEYGGNSLKTFYEDNHKNSKVYNKKNIISILNQLFNVLYTITHRPYLNLHNDLKGNNIVYSINKDNSVKINLIDFGNSLKRTKLEGEEGFKLFKDKVFVNTPEIITNFILANKEDMILYEDIKKKNNLPDIKLPELVKTTYFKRWYYYPFVSIISMLLTDNEYSTGKQSYLDKLFRREYKDYNLDKKDYIFIRKLRMYEYISDINKLKDYIIRKIKVKDIVDLDILFKLIDGLYIEDASKRLKKDEVIELINKL